MFNEIRSTYILPKIWRKAHIIALLKPGKEPTSPKNFRPISFLCHLYKAFERMVHNRIVEHIDEKLIKEQAGFRKGKSCTGQLLNMTQFIENGFEKKYITGVALIDLTAAYDTVSHRILLEKIYNLTRDKGFMQIIQALLQHRRYYVTLGNKKSRWRRQKNGLPQGSVLAPILFNIYTNDQPITPDARHFIYADDTAIAVQDNNFEGVETKLESSLKTMTIYYKSMKLKPNPLKTQVCAFHLKNRLASRKLDITWEGVKLEHTPYPKYLGVNLDRSLNYKEHCVALKRKICARNTLLRKLVSSKWGAHPETVRISALALCFSVAEYACPMWGRSTHTKQIDTALNETVRIITGCLKPTPVDKLYPLAGIAPPHIRRQIASDIERTKQIMDERHPMFNTQVESFRLKSRKSFLKCTKKLEDNPQSARLKLWKVESRQIVEEKLPRGHDNKWVIWRTLNRLRTGVGRSRENLKKWVISDGKEDTDCVCGETQTMSHLLNCNECPVKCDEIDLQTANNKAIRMAEFWSDEI